MGPCSARQLATETSAVDREMLLASLSGHRRTEHIYAILCVDQIQPNKAIYSRRERLRRSLSVISSFSITAMPAGITFKVDVDPAPGRGDSGQLDVDLQDVLVELGETAREAGGGIVFLFDEMQFAEKDDLQALLAAFHRIAQRQLPVALVCAGLPQLPGRLAEASSYAERLFQYVEIGRLTEDAAQAALTLPAQREGVEYEQAALNFILARADRYPFFLQTYGRYAWLVAASTPITSCGAKAADTLAQEQLDSGFHRARFNRATAAERRYLAAISELGDDPQQTAKVSAILGAKPLREDWERLIREAAAR